MTKQDAKLKIKYLQELRKEFLIKDLEGCKSDLELKSQISELETFVKSDK